MTAPFDGPPLAAGSVLGFRHFDVTAEPALLGPGTTIPFMPGENLAIHDTVVTWNVLGSGRVQRSVLPDRVNPPEGHRVAMEGCRCGFYAYFHPEYSAYHSNYRVAALIEGYGLVSVGEHGFRAEKARLVAVTLPPVVVEDRKEAKDADVMLKMSNSITVSGALTKFKRHYAVPVFNTIEEMLTAHPIELPEGVPDPESNPLLIQKRAIEQAAKAMKEIGAAIRKAKEEVQQQSVTVHVQKMQTNPFLGGSFKVLPPPPPPSASARMLGWLRRRK